MCTKTGYDTFIKAEAAMRVIKSRVMEYKRTSPTPKRAYRCEDCGKIHLTSEKVRKKINAYRRKQF